MEVASFVFSAAQTLFTALKRSDVKELFSLFGYQSELEKLEKSVSRVKAVLKDAEAKQVLSEQDNDLVEKLRYAVYDADDLLDALITVAEQEEQQHLLKEGGGGGFTKKERCQEPDGEDWSKIQHVAEVVISQVTLVPSFFSFIRRGIQ